MENYKIEFTEKRTHIFEVEADSLKEALEMFVDGMNNREYDTSEPDRVEYSVDLNERNEERLTVVIPMHGNWFVIGGEK